MASYIANWPEVHFKGIKYKPGDLIPGLDDSTAKPLLKLKAVIVAPVAKAAKVEPKIETPAVEPEEEQGFFCDPIDTAQEPMPSKRKGKK